MGHGVKLSEMAEKMQLKNLTPDVDLAEKEVTVPDVNRPALQLAGYFDHFDSERVQIIGYVEYTFLEQMDEATKIKVYETLLAYKIPCIIFCRALKPDQELLEKAQELDVPIFSTEMKTSAFTAELIRWLNVQLAPCISIHGVLVDVYGVGVMIMGESGIGKSEAALELVRRGHRLVSDDVVEIRKVSDDTQNIELVITLEDWDREKKYDRLGMEEQYTEFLGNKVVCHQLPIRPGRNLSIIVETAAINYRQKKMGYNAAEELYKRVQRNLAKK